MTNHKLMMWLLLRAIASMAIGLVVVLNGQSWIQMATGSTVPEMAYFIAASITIVIVARLSGRRLLALAEADQKQKMAKRAPVVDHAAVDRLHHIGGVFRRPRSCVLPALFIATVLAGLSVLSPDTPWSGHLLLWGLALVPIMLGIDDLQYRVYVDSNTVRAKAFREQQFQLSDIAQVDVVTYKGKRTANVKLDNGKIVQFSEPLQDMSLLIALFESYGKHQAVQA